MDTETLARRIAGLREECARLGRELAESGQSLSEDEAFALAGQLQGVVNAAEGATAVAGAWGARFELTLLGTERVHPLGYMDQMASTQMALATGLTEGLASRKVSLGAALGGCFPRLLELLLAGEVPAASAHKVIDACAGLDAEACWKVDAALAPRLAGMDPARVAGEARRVATRVAADQVAAYVARTRKGRRVEVCPGEDGLTEWFASLPTATSSAMWAAVEELAGDYRQSDEALSVPESRADALADLVLRNVKVSAQVTLGVPVVSDRPAPEEQCGTRFRVEWDDEDTLVDAITGEVVRYGDLDPTSREELSWLEEPAELDGDLSVKQAVVSSGYAVSGTQLPGLGWVDPATLANLLKLLPFEVARAVLEAETGTLASLTTAAYRPPKAISEFVKTRDGTCRMWGCARPAVHCDLDHVKPWPIGQTTPTGLEDLCRRHHRFKQQGRWRPHLDPDGTVTWHGPDGATRTTEPQHCVQR
ncbi:HNH endonuclease [Phycicoccus jejuensis]|uniref:HNH endonuclease signature motif containing protein n=1 Tax=Phycicoccus jejuensis TaxID=367299 RepID=UPI00384AA1AC